MITAAASMVMLGGGWLTKQTCATERVATVQTCQVGIGCVEQITALRGTLQGAEEWAALSPVTGTVSAVYVQPGDRVQKGQALFRMDDNAQAEAVTAALNLQQDDTWLQSLENAALTEVQQQADTALQQRVHTAVTAMEALTVRAPADGIVQQVYAAEHGGLTTGSPGVAFSSEQQMICCSAVMKDTQQIELGMKARIMDGDTVLAWANVTEIGPVEALAGQSVRVVKLRPTSTLELPMGAAVNVEIIRQEAVNVPVLPVEALQEEDRVLWIAEGRCYDTPVEVLLRDEQNCWVNLPEGTQVVLRGETIVSGQRVREAAE